MNISNYTISHINLDHKKLLIPWEWLIGENKEILLVTKMGNLLLTDPFNKLYLLSIAEGSMELISNYRSDFFKNKLSAAEYYEIFQPNIIEDLERDDNLLKEGQIYGYLKLPISDGENTGHNIHVTDIYEYFILAGALHKEIDKLPKTELV